MFICLSTMSKIEIGEVIILKLDSNFNQIGGYDIGGNFIGYVKNLQPEGCLEYKLMMEKIFDNRILTSVAVNIFGNLILETQSAIFKSNANYIRVEQEGYGYLSYNKIICK